MALTFSKKKEVVAQVNAVASEALSAIGAEYRGLTVEQLTRLRVEAHKSGVYLRVVKNSLARRALEGTDFECMNDSMSGPLVLAFSMEDPGAAARIIKDFTKENDKLVVKMLSVGGDLLPAEQLAKLADLPTRDQALAMLMGVMKAPIEKFVRTLAEPHTKLVRTVAAIREQKEAA
ncbi:MAG: 50S ribosomal protein L10 [Gammaproteobacteria bacterium]|nr:50S ribosomal protein L10 [Gammaproteobacteria bacterium]